MAGALLFVTADTFARDLHTRKSHVYGPHLHICAETGEVYVTGETRWIEKTEKLRRKCGTALAVKRIGY